MKSSKLKSFIDVVLGLLSFLKWLPLGKYKPVVIAVASILGALSGTLAKCDSDASKPKDDPLPTQNPTKEPSLKPTTTPTHIPTSLPTPTFTLIVDRQPKTGNPFVVRYAAPFKSNTSLWIDKWKLQIMGHDSRTGFMIAPAVVVNRGGRRLLTARDLQGNVLASLWIEVDDDKKP